MARLSPLRGWRFVGPTSPVMKAPANIPCPSGTKMENHPHRMNPSAETFATKIPFQRLIRQPSRCIRERD
jgi:hypothetical protein